MSEMQSIEVKFKDKELIVDALKNMGYNPIINSTQQKMQTFGNVDVSADIIVKKSEIHGYADVGFEKVGNEYKLHIDSDDHAKFGLDRLKQKYAEANINKEVENNSKYSISSSEEQDEELVIRLSIDC